MTERIRRTNRGRLEVEVSHEARTFYARPWTVLARAELVADTENRVRLQREPEGRRTSGWKGVGRKETRGESRTADALEVRREL
jgi:hypothetical protein